MKSHKDPVDIEKPLNFWRKRDILLIAGLLLAAQGGHVSEEQLVLLPLSVLRTKLLTQSRVHPKAYRIDKTSLFRLSQKELKQWIRESK